VAQLQAGGGAGLDGAEAVTDGLAEQVGGDPAVHPRRGVDPRLAGAVIDDREHCAAPVLARPGLGRVGRPQLVGHIGGDRPVCRRRVRLRTGGVGASRPASRISRSTRLRLVPMPRSRSLAQIFLWPSPTNGDSAISRRIA
jgi:hypothetical protein